MFRAAIILLVVAIVAAVLGFGGIAGTATELAKIVFFVALVLAVIGFILGRGRPSALMALLGAGLSGAAAQSLSNLLNA